MATICLLILAASAAVGLAAATGLDFRAIHLAYSPGGFAEMSLIALSLGIEVPFVSLHHLGRMIIVVTGATLVSRWATKHWLLPKVAKTVEGPLAYSRGAAKLGANTAKTIPEERPCPAHFKA